MKILAVYSYNDIKLKFDFCGKDSDNPDKRLVDRFCKHTGSPCENVGTLAMRNKLKLDFCGKDLDNPDKQLVDRFCMHTGSDSEVK